MKLNRALNGTTTFLVDPKAVVSENVQEVDVRRDCGRQYAVTEQDTEFRLGKIEPGINFSIVNLTAGINAKIMILPDLTDIICYKGFESKGTGLMCQESRRGDYVRLASLDGKMWHVVESSGAWEKTGLVGKDQQRWVK